MRLNQPVHSVCKGREPQLHTLGSSQSPEAPLPAPAFLPPDLVHMGQALQATNLLLTSCLCKWRYLALDEPGAAGLLHDTLCLRSRWRLLSLL